MSQHFADLGLDTFFNEQALLMGWQTPTPIQQQAIPLTLTKQDIWAIARTGSGKTAAYLLPILHSLQTSCTSTASLRTLILVPTRELAEQVLEHAQKWQSKHHFVAIYGGVNINRQIERLTNHIDVVIACPGRLLDLHQRQAIDLSHVTTLIIDEVDRMVSDGFAEDILRIAELLSPDRQTCCYSATMPPDLMAITHQLMHDPHIISADQHGQIADGVSQMVVFTGTHSKTGALVRFLRQRKGIKRAIIFCRTKRGVDQLAMRLNSQGLRCQALHGGRSQNQRQKVIDGFRSGQTRLLLATDLASRGLDVEGVTHVINVSPPDDPATYVHRIGRTARLHASGEAWTFCDESERPALKAIQATISSTMTAIPYTPQTTPETASGPTSMGNKKASDGSKNGNQTTFRGHTRRRK